MAIAPHIKQVMSSKNASVIRKMFEEGAVLRKKYGDDKVFDFSLGNPDLEPPVEVINAIREVALSNDKGLHAYMSNAGYPESREAMAKKVSLEQGVKVGFENVIMSVGAAGALNSVMKAVLSPNDEVIVPSPFFTEYRNYVANFNANLIPVMCKDDLSLDIDAIKKSLTSKTAIVLINSPNNPTGKIYTEKEIINLTEVLKAHGESCGRYPYLVMDEPYRAITYNNKKVAPVFPYYSEAIVVSSFAKNLSLPGERIGYIAINPECKDVAEVVAACIFGTRVLGYVNAPAFFQHVIAKSWNAKADYSSYAKRCKQITSVMDSAGIEYIEPEGAFYLFCKVPSPSSSTSIGFGHEGDDNAFCAHLKDNLILCAPGGGFGGAGYFRIAYCCSEKTILGSAEAFKKARETW